MASPEEIAQAMQQELKRLQQKDEESTRTINALREEFANANDPEQVSQVARKAIIDIMPLAITQMRTLIEYAESESVRASLSRFVIACGLDKSKFEDSSTESLAALVKELAKND
jgi:hypothetical protein